MNSKILIKHSPNGIGVILDKYISFEELTEETALHFKEAARFFGKCKLAVTFTGRALTSEQEDILCATIEENSEITILCVFVEDKVRDSVYVRARKIMEDQAVLRAALQAAPKQHSRVSEFYTYPGSIPAGKVLRTAHNILVLGDIPEDAVLASERNIIVLGTLLGTAMAGDIKGTQLSESLSDLVTTEQGQHVILAGHMRPKRLIIDGTDWRPARAPERKASLFGRRNKEAEEIPAGIAYISDGQVVHEVLSETSLQRALIDIGVSGLNL